jgi:hypothetical protein
MIPNQSSNWKKSNGPESSTADSPRHQAGQSAGQKIFSEQRNQFSGMGRNFQRRTVRGILADSPPVYGRKNQTSCFLSGSWKSFNGGQSAHGPRTVRDCIADLNQLKTVRWSSLSPSQVIIKEYFLSPPRKKTRAPSQGRPRRPNPDCPKAIPDTPHNPPPCPLGIQSDSSPLS